jgi:hypothetical protein
MPQSTSIDSFGKAANVIAPRRMRGAAQSCAPNLHSRASNRFDGTAFAGHRTEVESPLQEFRTVRAADMNSSAASLSSTRTPGSSPRAPGKPALEVSVTSLAASRTALASGEQYSPPQPKKAAPNPSLNRTRYGRRRKPGAQRLRHCRAPGLHRLPPPAG